MKNNKSVEFRCYGTIAESDCDRQLYMTLRKSIQLSSVCTVCNKHTFTVTEKKLRKCLDCYGK